MPRAAKGKTKKAAKGKLTQNTMQRLRAYGYVIEKTEHFVKFPPPFGRRVDLFDCIDVLGLDPCSGKLLGVQSTSRTAVSTRIKKIKELVESGSEQGLCIEAFLIQNLLQVWGWDLVSNKKRLLKVSLKIEDGSIVEDWRKDC